MRMPWELPIRMIRVFISRALRMYIVVPRFAPAKTPSDTQIAASAPTNVNMKNRDSTGFKAPTSLGPRVRHPIQLVPTKTGCLRLS